MSTNQNSNNNDLFSWIAVILGLTFLPPLGLFLLFRQLMGKPSGQKARQSRHPYDLQREGGQQPGTQGLGQGFDKAPKDRGRRTPQMGKVKLSRGKGMTITGAIIAGTFGFASFASFIEVISGGGWDGGLLYNLEDILMPLVFCCAGLVTMYAGRQRTKKSKRFRRYLTLIGRRDDIPVSSLAHAMSVSVSTACDDLQEMLDDGTIPTGYLDMGSGRLILSDEGLREEPAPQPAPEPEVAETPEPEEDTVDTDGILMEIQQINDAIADPVMSRKIDRIGTITSKIFEYQRKNPGKDSQLRSFLSYYLPTTLRILKAYAQMEAQGVDGENIHAAKARIEGMMDKVVDGYEKQLDKLFQNDAMDITTDVEVLERMLEKDGLSRGGLTLGGS